MGREEQPQGEYSREAYDEAEAAVGASAEMVGKEYDRSAKGRGERAPGASHAKEFGADVQRSLQVLRDLLGLSYNSAAWKGLESAKRRLEEIRAANEDEGRELNAEFDRRRRVAERALQDLFNFEREELQMRGSTEASEDTTAS